MPISIASKRRRSGEPEYARLVAKGKGVGAIVSMDTQFNLSEAAGGTAMQWEADVSIAGPVGSMGQRVLQPIVNQQVGNVLSALEKQVEEAAGEPAGHGEPAEAGGSSGSGERAPADGSESEASGEAPSEPAPGGAEEGIHPASPETYSEDPEGPTHSTRDEG